MWSDLGLLTLIAQIHQDQESKEESKNQNIMSSWAKPFCEFEALQFHMGWRSVDVMTLDKIYKHPQAKIAVVVEAMKNYSSVHENIDQISSVCFYSGEGAEQSKWTCAHLNYHWNQQPHKTHM